MRVGHWFLVFCVGVGLCGCFGRSSTKLKQDPNQDPNQDPTQTSNAALCKGKEQGSVNARVRRLSRREYNNVIEDLLGDTSRPADGFLEDSYANGYDNGSALLTVQTDQALEYQTAAETLAQRAIASSLQTLLPGCDPAVDREACVNALLGNFLLRAFRRPPTAEEVGRLRTVYDQTSQLGGFALGMQATLEAILQSPQFLYREELGADPIDDGSTRVRLADYELASELSFFLTGSMPDDQLFQAAQEGGLHTPEDLRREGERLLATPKAKANLRSFVAQWLATDRLASATKDPAQYPNFSPQLAQSMEQELNRFVDNVLWDKSRTLRELFTSTSSFVDDSLGSLYGVAGGPQFPPVELDPTHRQGILTRAGFLTTSSSADNSSPVGRGVFVQQVLFCTKLPSPPLDVLQRAMMDRPDPNQTTREHYAQHSTDAFCQGCHRMIDPLGFGFEEFDAIGAYRTTERGKPVDTSGALVGTDVDGPFTGASELAQKLVKSKRFENCAVTQLFRFAMGKGEETEEDGCAIRNVSDHFSVDVPIQQALLDYVSSRVFVERTPEKDGGG